MVDLIFLSERGYLISISYLIRILYHIVAVRRDSPLDLSEQFRHIYLQPGVVREIVVQFAAEVRSYGAVPRARIP